MHPTLPDGQPLMPTANLRTKIMDFRGLYSSLILIKRGNSRVHREFPGKFESSNLSRGNLSREMGRNEPIYY